MFGPLPSKAGIAFRPFPAYGEVAFRFIPTLGQTAAGLIAIAVCWLVILVSVARGNPRLGAMIGAPVGILDLGINGIGDAFASQASSHRPGYSTNGHADGSAHCAYTRSCQGTAGGTGSRTDGMILTGSIGSRIHQFAGPGPTGPTAQATDHTADGHAYRPSDAAQGCSGSRPTGCSYARRHGMAGEIVAVLRVQSFSGGISGSSAGKAAHRSPYNHADGATDSTERCPSRRTRTGADARSDGFSCRGMRVLRVNRLGHTATRQAACDRSHCCSNGHADGAAYGSYGGTSGSSACCTHASADGMVDSVVVCFGRN